MHTKFTLFFSIVAVSLLISLSPARGDSAILTNMPAYFWYHGCSPTAAGMIMGYWDVHGYDNLFDASGWDNVKVRSNVQDHLVSPAHIAKYHYADDPDLPTPPNTSLASWMNTSVGIHSEGASNGHLIDDAIEGFAEYRGYEFESTKSIYWSYGDWDSYWSDFCAEIDAGRPMLFNVDSSGNGLLDHSVAVLAYDDNYNDSGERYYGCYDTWSSSPTIRWERFRCTTKDSSYAWGIRYVDTAVPVPEPATMSLLAIGAIGLLRRRRRRISRQ